MRDVKEIRDKVSPGWNCFKEMYALALKCWPYDPANDGIDDDKAVSLYKDIKAYSEKYRSDSRLCLVAHNFALAMLTIILDEEEEYKRSHGDGKTGEGV